MARRKIAVDAQRQAYFLSDIVELKIKKLRELMYREDVDLNGWQIKQAYYHGPGKYEYIDKQWRSFKVGDTWGGNDEINAFLQCKTIVSPHYDGKPLYLEMYINGYSLLKVNGRALQGLDYYRQVVLLTQKAKAGEEYLLEIEATVKHPPYEFWYGDVSNVRIFTKSRLVMIDKDIEGLYYDLDVSLKAGKIFNNRPELQDFVLGNASKAANMLNFNEENFGVFKKQVLDTRLFLQKHLFNNSRFKSMGEIHIVGNSHLDLVYLWPYKETIRKNARTTASTLRLMEEYPEFSFLQSQPKLYEDMEKYFPGLFSEVKRRQKEGRWEITGGMYVEPDCNLPCGESLIRQILFGKRYIKKRFGVDSTVCWLPDVFGITWSLPQILRKSGMKFLSSIKLTTWNDTNDFPHHTFWWKGLDGSRVLVHFPPTHLNKPVEPEWVDKHWNLYKQKEANSESMMMGGLGDGGSGMTREFLEHIRRMKNFPGLPNCSFETAESWFCRQWEKHADKENSLPEWYDELYMEGHRGTYTTAALLKKLNRKCELLYRDAEAFSAFAHQLGLPYQREKLNDGWRTVLLHQFHDTLPGTHPQSAFKWAVGELQQARQSAEDIRRKALEHIARCVKTDGESLIVFNSLSWLRTSEVRTKIRWPDNKFRLIAPNGDEVVYQVVSRDGDEVEIIFVAKDLPSFGYTTFILEAGSPLQTKDAKLSVSTKQMENKFFHVTFSDNGCITSIYDKINDRQVLADGAEANRFQLFEDIPGPYSAWDIIPEYKDKEIPFPGAETIEVVEKGPVRIVVEISHTFTGGDPKQVLVNTEGYLKTIPINRKGASKIVQRVVLYSDVPRIDFETHITWHETEKLLKVSFPVNVFAKNATYDIPFGNIERPTHYNTSWDEAKFEVCGHKWADLSEGGYGVSILNDCKYGWDIFGNTIRLTLLKAPTRPSMEMDRGNHAFTYSVYPHAGTWRQADTIHQAYQLNVPAVAVQQGIHDGELPAVHSFIQMSAKNVFVEALKLAEDSDEMVVRLCEHYCQRGSVTLTFDKPIKSARECNLVEQDNQPAESKGRAVIFRLDPYELKTFKIKF